MVSQLVVSTQSYVLGNDTKLFINISQSKQSGKEVKTEDLTMQLSCLVSFVSDLCVGSFRSRHVLPSFLNLIFQTSDDGSKLVMDILKDFSFRIGKPSVTEVYQI